MMRMKKMTTLLFLLLGTQTNVVSARLLGAEGIQPQQEEEEVPPAEQQQQQQQQQACSSTDQQWNEHPDRMHSFPGWEGPLPTRWFSGYLDYTFEGNAVHTHYVLVEAEAEEREEASQDATGAAASLPLLYWSNGGPGASSLYGLLTEIGPLLLSDDSLRTESYANTGIPTPLWNPYSWTKLGSLLIIDQPASVGYSYCNNDTQAHNCGNIDWNDELTSANAYLALQTFYATKFPPCSFRDQELYLTGESYAGIYVPTLARRILAGNNDDDTTNQHINLQGFAVGDGCLGTETSICGVLGGAGFVDFWHLVFMAGHHQIPIDDFRMVMKACHHSDQLGFLTSGTEDDQICKMAVEKVNREMGGYFTYALYDDCTYRNGLQSYLLAAEGTTTTGTTMQTILQAALNDYPCGGGLVMQQYLALDLVKEAFNVGKEASFFETDNAEGDFKYTPTEPDLTGFYQSIVNDDKVDLKVLIYNGDTDPSITSFAAQNWTSHLHFTETQHWRPWTTDACQNMGGYVTRYAGNFDFLTIRGAGHMVPTYKPAATFAFMQAWMQGEEYPTFDPQCKHPPPPSSFEKHSSSRPDDYSQQQ